jgi:hypothetical protein
MRSSSVPQRFCLAIAITHRFGRLGEFSRSNGLQKITQIILRKYNKNVVFIKD